MAEKRSLIHRWTEEEKEFLVNFIDERKNANPGANLTLIIKDYLETVPMDGRITETAVRAMYKKAKEEKEKTFDNIVYKKGSWSYEEDEKVKELFLANKGVLRTDEIFDEISKVLNRNPKSVKCHFYSTICKNPMNAEFLKKARKFGIEPKQEKEEIVIDPYSFEELSKLSNKEIISVRAYVNAILEIRKGLEEMGISQEEAPKSE